MNITVLKINDKELFAGAKVRHRQSKIVREIFIIPEGKTLYGCVVDGSYIPNYHIDYNTVMHNKSLFELVPEPEVESFTTVEDVVRLLSRVTISAFGTDFRIRIERDNKNPEDGRIFLQIQYNAPDTKTGEMESWSGRKWYLSDHMTKDEIIKTAYAAFEMAVKHEVLEGFKVDGKSLFNPHVDFEALLTVSHIERGR